MLWALDPQGAIAHLSEDLLDFTHREEREARGKPYYYAVHPDDVPQVREIVDDAIVHATPFGVTCRLKTDERRYSWIFAEGTPAHAPIDGSLLGYLGSTTPLSDPPDPPKVFNVLGEIPAHEHQNDRNILALDAIAYHLLEARRFMSDIDETTLETMLDLILTEVAHRLAKAAA